MKFFLLKLSCISLILHLASCKKEEMILFDTKPCTISQDYNSHPKHTIYQDILDEYAKKGIVGLSLYVKKDNAVWQGSSGFAVIENSIPLQPCHFAYSASVGKTYCATAILLLVENGQLNLDNKIANGNEVTIR